MICIQDAEYWIPAMIAIQALSDQVYKHLLGEILAGAFASGAALREPELAATLGVSRTPIREALGRLAKDGLLEIRPNRSAIVRRLRSEELRHIYQVREALEGLAAELASGKLTRQDLARLKTLTAATRDAERPEYVAACHTYDVELHRMVALRSGNPVLAAEIRRFHHLVQLVRNRVGNQHDGLAVACREHAGVIAALKSGDGEESRRAMIAHIRTSCEVALRHAVDDAAEDGPTGALGPAAEVLAIENWGLEN